MKKKNIGICIITTTLLMGSHAKATELVLAKDHTNVVNQAAEIAAYKKEAETLKRQAVQQTVSQILSFTQVTFMPCGYGIPEHRSGLIYNWPIKIRN